MRIEHNESPTSILTYILDLFYSFKNVKVKELSILFNYDISSIYALIRRIKYDLIRFNSDYQIVKKSVGTYILKEI